MTPSNVGQDAAFDQPMLGLHSRSNSHYSRASTRSVPRQLLLRECLGALASLPASLSVTRAPNEPSKRRQGCQRSQAILLQPGGISRIEEPALPSGYCGVG